MKDFLITLAIWLTALIIVMGVVKLADAHKASFYSYEVGGRKTASGEVFLPSDLTAAHRTLPFGTIVKVRNLKNGKWIIVRINDRGPSAWTGRSIDLSYAAAEAIGMVNAGVVEVEMTILT